MRTIVILSFRNSVIFCLFTLLTLCFEQLRWDFYVQNFFYNTTTHAWIIDASNPFLRTLFYTGPKYTIAGFGCLILIFFILSFKKSNQTQSSPTGSHYALTLHQQKYLFIIMALIIIPSVTALLKEFTYVHCPSRLVDYGGPSAFRGLFDVSVLPDLTDRGKCFPAGHASGGFALMCLYFVLDTKKWQRLGLTLGLTLGWIMALYQMLKGAHFLSHSLATMLLSWLILVLLHHAFKGIFKNNEHGR